MTRFAKFVVLGVMLVMANTVDSDVRVIGIIEVSTAASGIPSISGGSGAMDSSGRQNGSIHLRTDTDQLPEVLHNLSVVKMGLGQHSIEARLVTPLVANAATIYRTYAPRNIKLVGISRAYATVPASVAGTVLARIQSPVSPSIDLLVSSAENEEGLTDDTLTAHTLTGTPGDLLIPKGQVILITITSDNADMMGGVIGQYHIYYEDN